MRIVAVIINPAVIGTRLHVVATRRLLRSIRRKTLSRVALRGRKQRGCTGQRALTGDEARALP
jgi:hypothetical protein